MPMSNLRNTPVEVLTSFQRRKRWSHQELEIIRKINEHDNSVATVARYYGIVANQIFQWRKAYWHSPDLVDMYYCQL